MSVPLQPFPLPQKLPSPLASVHHYWNDLIRAENEMPFADDVNLSAKLPALAGNLLLVDVFANPQRFRFNHLGDELIHRLGANVTSKFADEVELHGPFEFFIAQASATIEARSPTWYSSRRGTRASCFRPGATAASSCYSAQSRSRQRGGGALWSIARKYSAVSGIGRG